MNYHPGPPRRPGRTRYQGLVLAAIRPGGLHEMIAAVPDDTLLEFDLIHVDEHAIQINHSGAPNTNLTTITYHVQIGGSVRGHTKTQVALRDRLPVGLRPRLAEFTAAD